MTFDGFKIAEEDLALRGPGEVFGVKQAGHLLDFIRVADLVRDAAVLEVARRDAVALIREEFWAGADARLAEFSPETRGRFERVIEARIPRLTDAEAAIVATAQARMEAKRAARTRMAAARAERAGQGRIEPPTRRSA